MQIIRNDSDIIITDDEGRVTGWSYKKDARTEDYRNLVNAGLYVMQRSAVDEIEKIQEAKGEDKVDLEKDTQLARALEVLRSFPVLDR